MDGSSCSRSYSMVFLWVPGKLVTGSFYHIGNKKGTAAGRPIFELSLENHCLFLTLRCIKRQCGTHAKIGSGIFMPFFLDFVPNCSTNLRISGFATI